MTAPGFVESVASVLTARGVDLSAFGIAWARALPTVIAVPAFGLRALPMPLRAMLGAAIAIAIFPAMAPFEAARANEPWIFVAFEQAVAGVPIALATAIPLWAATMAGGAIDTARNAEAKVDAPTVEKGATTFGVFFSLLASAIFLATGGPARVAASLVSASLPAHPFAAAAHDLVAGISAAVAIAAPILAATVVLDAGLALTARAASPAPAVTLTAPARTLGLLVVLALVLERIARVLALAQR